jgi:amino acid transporter
MPALSCDGLYGGAAADRDNTHGLFPEQEGVMSVQSDRPSVGGQQYSEDHRLRANAVSLVGDWIASVANVAPSSSVAFTLALLLGFAGYASPLTVLVVCAGMLAVATGYSRLNNWKSHAGAPYVWVGEVVTPVLGYATGLLAILAATLANVGNITLAGSYLLGIISPSTTYSKVVIWLVTAAVMALVVYIAIRGIKPSITVQRAIIIFEYTIVVLFVILALVRVLFTHSSTTPGLTFHSTANFRGLASAAVVCGFLYAGWESPLILSEESEKPNFNPGRAALLGVTFLAIWYAFLILVFQGIASPATLLSHGTDVLSFAGGLLLSDPWGRLLPIAVFSAVFATTQMQLAESSRVLFAMARDGLMPRPLARLAHSYKTPIVAALVLGVIPPIVLIPYLSSSSATTAIGYAISADGLIYLLMYGIIALSCVYYYRRLIGRGGRDLWISGLIPLAGGLMMLFLYVYGLATQKSTIAVVAAAGGVLCLLGGVLARIFGSAPYFHMSRSVHAPAGVGAEDRSDDAGAPRGGG